MPLKVKKLTETAIAPTVANKGEDVAFDLYSDETIVIPPQSLGVVKTGISIEFTRPKGGALILCRSSMAKNQASIEGGVIDAGYRGEILVMIRNNSVAGHLKIVKGNKFAQMIRIPVVTDNVKVVPELTQSQRGEKGFGSSGK